MLQVAATLKLSTGQDGPQLELAPGAHCNSRAVVSLAVQMLVCQSALPASSQPPVSALQPNPCKAVLQVNAILNQMWWSGGEMYRDEVLLGGFATSGQVGLVR